MQLYMFTPCHYRVKTMFDDQTMAWAVESYTSNSTIQINHRRMERTVLFVRGPKHNVLGGPDHHSSLYKFNN